MDELKKIVLFIFIGWLGVSVAEGQKKTATLRATMNNLHADYVMFQCVQDPVQNVTLPYTTGDTVSYTFAVHDIVMIKVNGWIPVCLEPGDRVEMHVVYQGRNVERVTFSGNERGVVQNDILWQMQELKQKNKFWSDLLAAVVLEVTAPQYHQMVKDQYARETALLRSVDLRISPHFRTYAIAEMEGLLFYNMIKYPDVYSEVRKKTVEESYVADYWTYFDHYTFKTDPISLSSRAYCAFLLIYKEYCDRKEAWAKKTEYVPESDVQKQYRDLADFYEGELRDAALYAFVSSLLAKGQDFETAEKLTRNYLKKYNKIKSYKQELTQLLR